MLVYFSRHNYFQLLVIMASQKRDLFSPFPFHKPPRMPVKLIEFNLPAEERSQPSTGTSDNQKQGARRKVQPIIRRSFVSTESDIYSRKLNERSRLAPLPTLNEPKNGGRSSALRNSKNLHPLKSKDPSIRSLLGDMDGIHHVTSEDSRSERSMSEASTEGFEAKYLKRIAKEEAKHSESIHEFKPFIKQSSYKGVEKFDTGYVLMLNSFDKKINSGIRKLARL